MAFKPPFLPTFRLSAWSVALMAVFAAAACVGSFYWGMLPQVLYVAFSTLIAWAVAAYMANMSMLVKAFTLAVGVAIVVLGLVSIASYPQHS